MQSPWIQGSHRIPLDPKGSHWTPLVSTDLAWYKWSTDPLSPSGSTVLVGPRILQNFHGLLLSYWTQGVPGCRDPTGSHFPPDPIGSQRIPMDSLRFHRPCWVHMVDGSSWVLLDPLCLRARGSYMGPRTLQNFHGLLLSYWTQGVPGCRDPTGSHWIPPDPSGSHWVPRAAVLVNPRCPWIQGSHRIRRDANGSRWIPLGSTGLAGYTWLSVPPGSYWIHGVLASTDPTGFLRLAAGLLRPW